MTDFEASPTTTPTKPHQVTPEIAEQGNRLLADAQAAHDRAIELDRSIESMERMKDSAWQECRAKRREAGRVLLGEAVGYRGY